MKIVLTCPECGHKEWGTSEGQLMNKIKMWNHASKWHPEARGRVIALSVPKESFSQILRSA